MKTITITGLSRNTTTEDSLINVFSIYSIITDIRVPTDKTSNKSKGIAFIAYKTPEGASTAI